VNKILLPILLLLLAILFLIFRPKAQEEKLPPPPNPHLETLLADYEQYLLKKKKKHQLPGLAVAIVRDSSISFLKGIGQKKAGHQDPIDIHTIFRIGSLSKGFAGLLAGRLEEEGQFSLEDKLVKYIPEFSLKSKEHSRQVTLSHLLSHTAGFPYHTYTNLVEHGKTIEQIIPAFRKVKPVGRVGEIYSYQNASFSLIDPVIQKTTGQPYDQVLQKLFFDPLGMRGASTSYQDIQQSSNHAFPHSGSENHWRSTRLTEKYYTAIPAGGINASIQDMAYWLKALLGQHPDVLSKEVLDKAFTPQVKTPIKSRYFSKWPKVEGVWYAHGWRILDYGGENIIYHGGLVNGFRAEIAINRKEKIGVCILTNAPSRFANRCIPAFLDRYEAAKDSIKAWELRSLVK